MHEQFIKALDAQRRDWWLKFADQRALAEVASGQRTADKMRESLSIELLTVVRAAVECGLVEWTEASKKAW